MRIAIIGSGISGLACAWLLSGEHEVVLFEANDYLGGHTHTHAIDLGGRRYQVDSGFIVFNSQNYVLLCKMFDTLELASQPTTMSFALRNERSGLEYNATSLDGLFCQRRNLLSPRHLGMVRDILRFYRQAPALLQGEDDGLSLGDYLAAHRYGDAFRDDHLLPMASALWSSPSRQILQFPIRYLLQFMANHHMLQLSHRPQWRVVQGGSDRYVQALRRAWQVQERISCAVTHVRRDADGVQIDSAQGRERYDQVVFACHSDQALALLGDASERERDILSAISYQSNETVLHTDTRVLPRQRKAWAAWNALVPATGDDQCMVSYWMNLLQTLDAPEALIVSLNCSARIDPQRVLKRMRYAHPVYNRASVAAQRRKAEIQGHSRSWFAGAYWGWGFHEDGMRSAVEVAQALGVRWP